MTYDLVLSCGLRLKTCLALKTSSRLSFFVRACVAGYYRACLAPFVLYRSSNTYLLYVVQTRGGWLRAARSIPKVASAYRLHARVARVLGASRRLRPSPLAFPTKTIFPSLEFVLPPLCENPPSFSRNVPRNINDSTKKEHATFCTNFITYYTNGSMNIFYFYEI